MSETFAEFHYFENQPSYKQFEHFMKNNIPCTFGCWISQDWGASKVWVKDEKPNFKALKDMFGQETVSVHRITVDQTVNYYQSTLADFIDYWVLEHAKCIRDIADFPDSLETVPHYMKDWHFMKCCNEETPYTIPDVFCDDWLNSFWKSRNDVADEDYIFSYFGPAGSFTPFHADVFRSYSWSVNVCGEKLWLILYPGEEGKLSTKGLNVINDCREKRLKYRILRQRSGEGIFVPSGWWHQVLNIKDTISINHNWCNFHCIPRMWTYLKQELDNTEKELIAFGCQELMSQNEWVKQCHIILRSNVGIGFLEFVKLILFNSQRLFGQCVLEDFNLDKKFRDLLIPDDSTQTLSQSSYYFDNVRQFLSTITDHPHFDILLTFAT